MEEWAIAIAIPFFAALHRFRGGGLFTWKAPFHRRYIAALVLLIVSLLTVRWEFAIFVTLQYLLLVLLPWGRWYTIGEVDRQHSSGNPDAFEAYLERITSKFKQSVGDYICFAIRNLISLLPMYIAAYWLSKLEFAVLGVLLGIAIVECYRVSWIFFEIEDMPTEQAELYSGLLIGATVAAGYLLL